MQTYMARCAIEGQWDDVIETPFDMTTGVEDLVLGDLFVDEAADPALDKSGFGWGRSCPAPPEFFGTTLDLEDFCGIMQMIGALVLAIGALHSIAILRGGRE